MDRQSVLIGKILESQKYLAEELRTIKADVKSLLAFKWKMIGASGLAAFVATVIVEMLKR